MFILGTKSIDPFVHTFTYVWVTRKFRDLSQERIILSAFHRLKKSRLANRLRAP